MHLSHVTPTRNLGRILREGLLPARGPRSRAAHEPHPAIYCFCDRASLECGTAQWFFDLFDDRTRLALLRITVPRDIQLLSDVAWERHILTPIPSAQVCILSRDYGREHPATRFLHPPPQHARRHRTEHLTLRHAIGTFPVGCARTADHPG